MGKKTKSGGVELNKDWQAEDDLRTLIRAQEIKADKGRLRAALAKRDEMKKSLGGIRG